GDYAFAAGQSSVASGNFSTAVGQSAMATGNEASAFGQGATASGAGSLALGQGAQALATNSVAIGNNTVADQPNTVSLGGRRLVNIAPGIASSDGATVGQVNQASKRANGGIATAMAMGGVAVPETKLYAVSANLGAYRGETALAGGVALRLTDNATLNGSLGLGISRGDLGGRVGVTF